MGQASADMLWLDLSFEIGVGQQVDAVAPEELEVWIEDTPHGPQLHYAAYDASGGFMAEDTVQPDESGTRFHLDLASNATVQSGFGRHGTRS